MPLRDPLWAAQLVQYLTYAVATAVVSEPYSFTRSTAFFGLGNWNVTNVEATSAYERTPGNVVVHAFGANGFSTPGDRMCWPAVVSVQLHAR